jgi:hypothetical protein
MGELVMTSGRYTAYHIYQNLSFPEAQKAATRPYKLPEYQCRHSQRGYLFQFENMVERLHFDAANTSCCDEPVLNFANKPQYAPASKPMTPGNCARSVQAAGCTILEVSIEGARGMCASSSAKIRRIKVQCPAACHDLAAIQGGGTLAGTYGSFRSVGMEAGDILILDYAPYQSSLAGWYDHCSGTGRLTEEFCGGYSITYTLSAGLNYPNGCGCDCCGDHGSFPPPYMIIKAPAAVTADWTNTLQIASTISGDSSCSGGTLTGMFAGIGGGTAVPWTAAAQYHSNGFTRYVTRPPGPVGSAGNSACCGGSVIWEGTDGCGGYYDGSTVVYPRIGGSTVIPESGSILYEFSGYSFRGSGACSTAAGADLTLIKDCIANTVMPLERSNGYLSRRFDGPLRFSGTDACSGCCGNGWIAVSFNDGCNGHHYATYEVKRPLAPGAYADVAGRLFRCEQFYRTTPPTGTFYRIARADVHCDNSSGSFSYPFGDYYYTLSECLSGISGGAAPNMGGAGGCGGLSGGATCCLYTDNGQAGYDFRSRVVTVSGKCCIIETENGAWINSGTGAQCCPN